MNSEKQLRGIVKGLLALDILPVSVAQGLAEVLAASEQTDLDLLWLMVKALEGSERGFSEHYMEEGDYEAARDCTMKANGMGKILDVMAEYFGGGED